MGGKGSEIAGSGPVEPNSWLARINSLCWRLLAIDLKGQGTLRKAIKVTKDSNTMSVMSIDVEESIVTGRADQWCDAGLVVGGKLEGETLMGEA